MANYYDTSTQLTPEPWIQGTTKVFYGVPMIVPGPRLLVCSYNAGNAGSKAELYLI